MKITVEIGGKDYVFEMTRSIYKEMLKNEEYAKMQNELMQKSEQDKNIADSLLQTLIFHEQIFCYSLKLNQPNMPHEEMISVLDLAIEEYGNSEVEELITKIIKNFTQGNGAKKKMSLRIS